MKIIFKTLEMFVLLTLIASCTKEYVTPTAELPTNVSFSTDIQPIFTNNCVACHGGSTSPNLTASKAYASLTSNNLVVSGNASGSKLYSRMTGANGNSVMPPSGKLSTSDLNKVLVWINEGAKNN